MHGIRHHLRAIWRWLGVHWPTDVLVGGAVGTAQAMGIWGMAGSKHEE
jgi:membrane-associated phospholipid phosphatase